MSAESWTTRRFGLGLGGAAHAVLLLAATLAAALWAAGAAAQHRDNGGPLAYHTFLSYDGTHGVQIEYMDAGGAAYLWYPGENAVLRGAWRQQSSGEICFAYGGYVFELTPNIGPGDWICMTMESFYATTRSKTDGDVFNLRSGRVPFVMRRTDYFGSFRAVQAAAGQR